MSEHHTHIGERTTWGRARLFGVPREDRRQHTYVIGRTGLGKSTLLRNLLIQDIEAGEGVALLDPHGDLAEEVLDHIPSWRADDVVYFNPADTEWPIGFNLFTQGGALDSHLVASTIVSAFKHLWRDSWGPRLEYILANTLATLLEHGNTSLLSAHRMLTDEDYRASIVRQVKDPILRNFWEREFGRYDARFRTEATAPILNKLGRLLSSPLLRNILGQVKSSIDLAFMMDDRRILIANLSKGRLGEDKANLLGSLLVSAFHMAALQRASQPEEDRPDFYLYLDEFQNFSTDAFASILSEARKYRLNLILAHQYLDQLRPELQKAVFGNAGTLVCFGVGAGDAEFLSESFHPYRPESLRDFDRGEICVRMIEGGAQQDPFVARTLLPIQAKHQRRSKFVKRSREKYGRNRAVVEDKISRWLGG